MRRATIAFISLLLTASWAVAQQDEKQKLTGEALSVISPGAEPHRKIRYAPAMGTVYTMKVVMSTSVGREVEKTHQEPVHSPQVVLTLRVVADDYPDGGGTAYAAEVTDVDLSTRTGVTPQILEKSRTYFEGVKGSKFQLRIGARGQTYSREGLPDIEDNNKDDVAWFVNKQIELFNHAMRFVVMQTPQEDVGPGAKWKILEPWNIRNGQYIRSLDVEWSAADKGEPHLRASISSDWKSPTQITPESERNVANQALKLSGSLRSVLLPASPFPSEADFKSVSTWQVLAHKSDGSLVPGVFTDTYNLRVTTKVEPPKAKGSK